MKHLFVPYEISLLAKEKGFDEPCFTYWFDNKNGSFTLSHNNINLEGVIQYQENDLIIAPLYQQLVDWFREKHNIVIWIEIAPYVNNFNYRSYIKTEDNKMEGHKTSDYYQALEAVIIEAFKLI